MSKFNLDNYKNLCILYPGGGGGNHVTNMISTISGFQPLMPKVDSSSYIKKLTNRYRLFSSRPSEIFHVHIENKLPLDKAVEDKEYLNFLKSNTNKNLLYGHWASFQKNLLADSFVNLEECVWMIVTWPELNSLGLRRINKHNFYPQQPEQYNLPLEIELNIEENGPFTLLADETNGFLVNNEKLFSSTGWDYLNDVLQENLGISLPDESRVLHDIWFASMVKDVDG